MLSWTAACVGWLLVALLLVRARRRALCLAHAAHELRGSLAAIRLGVEVSPRQARQGLGTGRTMILDLEFERAVRALAGLEGAGGLGPGVPPREEAIVLDELVRDAVALRHVSAQLAGRRLEASLRAPGALVRGDRGRLGQALANLLANAVEHGAGTVTVRTRSSAGQARIEVEDEGRGLPAPPARLQIRPRCGRGHGLSIADAAAREHGGTLGVAPSRTGARMILTLPLASTRTSELAL